MEKQLKVLFILHLFYPDHCAGGERMCLNMAKYLLRMGHNVQVLLTQAEQEYNRKAMYDYEGITVIPAMRDVTLTIQSADIILTHLDSTFWAVHISRALKKPIIYISHNTHFKEVVASFTDRISVVYNSRAMAEKLQYPNRSIIVHPPVDFREWDFKGKPKEAVYITLINLNPNKGVKLFLALAAAMPEKMFLGVGGAYDPQIKVDLPNLVFMDNQPDMEPVYRKTRILLCPSKYESWGMCASEAMCNGIPVIYNPTFGLLENVGPAGIAVKDRNPDYEDPELKGGEHPDGMDPQANLKPWMAAIRKLDDPETYKKISKASRDRSRALDPEKELGAFNDFVISEFWQNQNLVDD